jgi:hypothetical protein
MEGDKRKLQFPRSMVLLGIVLGVFLLVITGVFPGKLRRNRTPVSPPNGFPEPQTTASAVLVGTAAANPQPKCWLPPPGVASTEPFWMPGPGDSSEARYPLSAEEVQAYLTVMGIAAICVPPELGGLYLNVDWNEAEIGAVTGRMVSLGFTELYQGSGWGRGYLVYATYDFAAGTEYDTFAGTEDYEAMRRGDPPEGDLVEAGDIQGFVRFHRGLCYGTCTVHRTIIFPFETHYIAIVQALGELGGGDDWDDLPARLRAGQFPPAWDLPLPAVDTLAQSLRFAGSPR